MDSKLLHLIRNRRHKKHGPGNGNPVKKDMLPSVRIELAPSLNQCCEAAPEGARSLSFGWDLAI